MTNKEKWIANWSEAFKKEDAKSPRTVDAIVVENTVAVVNIRAINNPKIGVAKCNPCDKFDLKTGLAIAYCRMNGFSVPSYVLRDEPKKIHISKIKVGEHFKYNNRIFVKTGNKSSCNAFFHVAYCLDMHKIYDFVETPKFYVEPVEIEK